MKLLVMDVDGTLTNGKIYMSAIGENFKAFDIKDGYAIYHILPQHQIVPVIITGRTSEIVTRRCEELHIAELYQGVVDKQAVLSHLLERKNSTYTDVAYIGDDLNDLPCMESIKRSGGIVGCPQNAVLEVRNIADFVSSYAGGNGAVREFIEWVIRRN